MANQMIALGARGPQLPDLGAIAQRYGGIMNAMRQQRTAEMQVGQRQQEMEIARNQESRAVEQHQIEQARKQMDAYTILAGQTMNRAGYENFLSRLDRDAPEIAAHFRTNLPPDQFNRDTLLQMVGSIADNFKTRFGALEHEVVQDAGGTYYVAQTGGTQPSGVFELQGYGLTPAPAGGGAPPAGDEPSTPLPDGGRVTPDMGPRDMLDAGVPPQNIPMGDPLAPPPSAASGLTPASAGGMAAPMPFTLETAPQIIQNAVQNRVIDQDHFQQLRDMVGPENAPKLASWMQQNQIRIQPAGEAPVPPSLRSAEYRPGEGAPAQFQQVQNAPAGTVYAPTGRPVQGRNPSVGQYPGSDLVPIDRSAAREGAESGASASARRAAEVATEEPLVAGRERAQRLERLREAAPKARSDVDSFLSDSARRVQAIDRMLQSRSYESIVGMIEGRIPRILQDERRSVAQRQLDAIVNTDVIQDIIAARRDSPTGGSPLGNVSNSDLQMYVNAANELAQTGDEDSFRRELLRMRQQLVNGMARARRTYEDTFRPLGREMEGLRLEAGRNVGPRYTPSSRRPAAGASRRTRGGATVSNW